ncbi:MAG: acetoacetate--CoA ligase [Candidatus Xenobium sp.]|jgi:acetoacetyl-CoA synthetase|nr:acetoacetate--CoA ligase [Burkholderiales bacterium]
MRRLLWTPSEEVRDHSKMMEFLRHVNSRYGKDFRDYPALYRWSVDNVADFWAAAWDFLDIRYSQPYTAVVDDLNRFPGARWFEGARLNYAENMLKYSDRPGPAIIFRGENHTRKEYSYGDVHQQVVRLATAFRREGIRPGDTIAAYMPNIAEAVIAMLASAAVGAVWCSCATDIGPSVAIDRLGQVEPRILVTADGYFYKTRKFDVLKNAAEIAAGIPSVQRVVVAHYAGDEDCGRIPEAVAWEEYLAAEAPAGFAFEQLPAEHPLVVMFSSGTTGKPKCMVQSAAGLLINQLKELVLHSGIHEGSTLLYITTCSWMMWNWQAAALGAGARLVLFDGNPSVPDPSTIWKILDQEKVTAFGLSASYIHSLMAQGFSPKSVASLDSLTTISQTGSALSEEGFEFVYREIKSDLHFNSIAGGTDINGCFAIGSPISPVYSGELQAPGLGMRIECYDEDGKPVRDEQGDLVCELPTPSMPLRFWNDPQGSLYRKAYFEEFPGVWHHGDYVMFHSDTGGITFYGRCDSVLKPSGVRIGTAEIYNQVDKLPEIQDSLAIGQYYRGDQRIVLFVLLNEGVGELDEGLKKAIKDILRNNASPRHVPAVILQAPDIPRTLNGKKVESVVTNIVNGRRVTNRDALANPGCLAFYEGVLPELQK